jgi:hypothetical protein
MYPEVLFIDLVKRLRWKTGGHIVEQEEAAQSEGREKIQAPMLYCNL